MYNKFSYVFEILLIMFIVATIGGTVVYFTYSTLLDVFPNAVSSGILASTISWWTSVKFVWLLNVLFKTTTSNNKSEK